MGRFPRAPTDDKSPQKTKPFVETVELKATNRKVAQKRSWSFTSPVPWTMIKAQSGQKYLKNSQGSLKYCQMADLGYRVVSTWKNSHSLQARGRASLKVSSVETWWRFYDYCDKYLATCILKSYWNRTQKRTLPCLSQAWSLSNHHYSLVVY